MRLVSSQQTWSAAARTSRARSLRSPRLPRGVATTTSAPVTWSTAASTAEPRRTPCFATVPGADHHDGATGLTTQTGRWPATWTATAVPSRTQITSRRPEDDRGGAQDRRPSFAAACGARGTASLPQRPHPLGRRHGLAVCEQAHPASICLPRSVGADTLNLPAASVAPMSKRTGAARRLAQEEEGPTTARSRTAEGLPRPRPAATRRGRPRRRPGVAQHLDQRGGRVRDDPVDVEVDEPAHLVHVVDRSRRAPRAPPRAAASRTTARRRRSGLHRTWPAPAGRPPGLPPRARRHGPPGRTRLVSIVASEVWNSRAAASERADRHVVEIPATIVSPPRPCRRSAYGQQRLVGLDVGRGPLDVEVHHDAFQALEHLVEGRDPEGPVVGRAAARSGYASSARSPATRPRRAPTSARFSSSRRRLVEGQVADLAGPVGGAVHRLVVAHHEMAVPGRVDVELDRGGPPRASAASMAWSVEDRPLPRAALAICAVGDHPRRSSHGAAHVRGPGLRRWPRRWRAPARMALVT